MKADESTPTIDVAAIIESRPLGWYAARVVLACALVMFFDGYDNNVIAFAGPYLAPAYHLDKVMLSYLFSAANLGTLCGGFLFGPIGDRIGRRGAILLATASFGILTLALSLATNYWQFMALRFVNGIALGGAIPLIWALGTEYAATRYRATIVTLIMLGYGIGVSAAGPLSVVLIPRFGYLSVFGFGGAATLVATLVLLRALPESLRFLATSGRRPDLLARAVRRLAPERAVPRNAHFVLTDEGRSEGGVLHVAALFSGQLRRITPLLWAAYLVSSMTTFFLTNWGPIVYEGLGFSRDAAAWVTSSNSIAGSLGGLALMRFTDRVGVGSIAVFPAIAVPLLLLAGFAHVTQPVFIVLLITLSVFLAGSHFGITSITGIFYPTAHRALGTGCASSMGKIGSVAGPIIGGFILSSRLPLQHTFAVMAVCPAIFCACMIALGTLQRSAGRATAPAVAPSL
ncbi:MAG TPA: MFS transporter [Steroidobacteraceae bacterium]|nr:MFS transporter [Steroidobacteraceae bacterium]